ncbi:1,3-beta-glucan synthase regulator [Bacillus pseudomycoides]|uniref:SMI1/KNR4 family protein n=1 Tax=Bacillus TaxID=1386 RepID=UPI000BEC4C71|nr:MULTISPECIES: SMI1/KNR4 family protein [Bacillus]MCX2824467.1 SMI1/KNR4 family protein [Bacillus sp. DHT2]MDR4915797.1 SMI1/KNR4 family protein [Bacillus pseudomycoides]PDX97794.1 1,3-beta-glucan synthase regulator [Bacillus pseudomycoides]PEK82766.1 1,3-beta-glucan synthase regulator [Bacillus pseudomycoides]PEN10173.1 1,3-beta-glucan synthase regulator [Bacillus pseudomycoides]
MTKIQWDFKRDEVSEKDSVEVSRKIGVAFPNDYIECVKINHGAYPEPEVFHVNGQERVFGSLLKYNSESHTGIYNIYNEYKDTLPKELVPFGIDPARNLICFDYKNYEDNPIVVFWEHEDAWEKEAPMESEGITAEEAEEVARENVFYVASTFTEFLNKLHD